MIKTLLFFILMLASYFAAAVSVETSYCGTLNEIDPSPWRVDVSGRVLYLPSSLTQEELLRLQGMRGRAVCFEVAEREGKAWGTRVLNADYR